MPKTQPVSLATKLIPTDLTYGSGAWEVQEWYAAAYAPGRIVGWDPAATGWAGPGDPHHFQGMPMWLSEIGWMHLLHHPANIAQLAHKYFNKNITISPYWNDNFIVVMFTKNGGPPNVDVIFPILYETEAHPRVPAEEPIRLTADQVDLLGRVSDAAAYEHPTGDFEQLLKKVLSQAGMSPRHHELFRDELKAIYDRSLKKS